METDSLRTASVYINNQLLSRGLLRNGQTIDFARPDKDEGGMGNTMGRIISVVNDLILRRDRDAEQREALSQSIRILRADGLRQTTQLERSSEKHMEAQRRLGNADATERALRTQARTAEQAVKGLKDEMARMRALVGQMRAQCANDVRKRERTIEGMKKHVSEAGRARGSGKAVGVMSITVTPGIGAETGGIALEPNDPRYDLRAETNEFLTELAKGLSEENDNWIGLAKRTIDTLKALSGWDKEISQEEGIVVQNETGYESLSSDMDMLLDHLRTLLTNPSFVPLEEVEVRDEEIFRLRGGWERMEARWHDAVQMMEGWRQRMASSGQTVNLEELKMGLNLSPLRSTEDKAEKHYGLSVLEEDEGEGDTQADIDAMDDSEIAEPAEPDFEDSSSDSEMDILPEEPSEDIFDVNKKRNEIRESSSFDLPQSPLQETRNTNRGNVQLSPQEFSTIVEENTFDLQQIEEPIRLIPKSTPHNRIKAESVQSISPPDEVSLLRTSHTVKELSPEKALSSLPKSQSTPKLQMNPSSRLPRPRENFHAQESPLTMASIAAKLAATEREADAARVRAKIKAAKLNRKSASALQPPESKESGLMPPPAIPQKSTGGQEQPKENMDPVDVDEGEGRTRKRKATGRSQGGRANRRRSTLSPWELESLILGGAEASPSKE